MYNTGKVVSSGYVCYQSSDVVMLFVFQTLLTEDAAAIQDEDGKTVMLVAAEQGNLHYILFDSVHL